MAHILFCLLCALFFDYASQQTSRSPVTLINSLALLLLVATPYCARGAPALKPGGRAVISTHAHHYVFLTLCDDCVQDDGRAAMDPSQRTATLVANAAAQPATECGGDSEEPERPKDGCCK